MKLFFNLWVLGGVALFYFGPVEWPGARGPSVAVIVLVCLFGFNLGTILVRRAPSAQRETRLHIRTRKTALLAVGLHSTVSLILLALSTGRNVFSASAYTLDFGAAYDEYALHSQQLTFGPITQALLIISAILFPFALVAFIGNFNRDPLLVALFLGPLIISSLFRGTDKEIVDALVFITVAAYLHGMLTWRRVGLGILLVTGAAYLFVLRRVSRFGGDLPDCMPGSETCFNYDSWVAENFGNQAEAFRVFASGYITNGFQGMSLAVDLPWYPNWGVGHLPILKSNFCAVSEALCSRSDYQQSLTATGWDARALWTSVYTVIANDTSFWLVPIYFVLIGIVFQRSLKSWCHGKDPVSGASLVLIGLFFIYSSANMQLAITLDWAVATIVFLYITPWRAAKGPDSIPTGLPHAAA